MEQVNFVKYPILNRAQKRDIVNVSKGNTVYIMLLSIVFCVDARAAQRVPAGALFSFAWNLEPL